MTQTIPPLSRLPTFGEDGHVHVVVETPKGSPNKYAYADAFGAFLFKMVLPEATSFPYDFGMIPSTKGADGDPLDVLLLLDAPAFPGCLLEARLVGVIEAEQCERDGTWERNDRLVGVAVKARTHAHIHALDDLRPGMLDEVEAFFAHYSTRATHRLMQAFRGHSRPASTGRGGHYDSRFALRPPEPTGFPRTVTRGAARYTLPSGLDDRRSRML
ncbi:inorganic diphosphatase [Methylobacterium sp. R2-1]|uniref:inorganic diphosphatase n=1 Tax=Methylobacterium sp. R2-1 TaxID=2587064 RepID=UPI0017A44D5D|nr:inorganic diphosphatase [Methylobacterium sp. R2-1]MBB2964510.1 inorganic pyrophosphatase [Methylobacterium sp. R2-1]